MHVKLIFPIASVSQAYKINICIPIIMIDCVVLVVIFISLIVTVML